MAAAEPKPNPASPTRILVVDDEELIGLALKETLTREGYEVVPQTSPLAALQRLQELSFALILTDQRMDELSGLEFLAQAKQIQPDATRVLMTGVLELDTVIKAINLGEIYRFIVKPWLREELLVTVKNAVQRYELIRRNTLLQEATAAMNQKLAQLNQSLAQQVAREAEQNRKLADLNQALIHNLDLSVEMVLKTMDAFHPDLGANSRRLRELCSRMATDLSLPEDQRTILEYSSWFHDLGLMAIPRRLIRNWQRAPHLLSQAEIKQVQKHPVLGQDLVGLRPPLAEVGKVIRAHHERFDGQGFPDGLAAEEIPWLARLLAVAAYYVESHLDETAATGRIQQESGLVFDPEAVRAFLRILPQAPRSRKERLVLMSELSPGMVMSRGVYNADGVLLIQEGQALSEPMLDKLRNHNRTSPIRQTLLVYG